MVSSSSGAAPQHHREQEEDASALDQACDEVLAELVLDALGLPASSREQLEQVRCERGRTARRACAVLLCTACSRTAALPHDNHARQARGRAGKPQREKARPSSIIRSACRARFALLRAQVVQSWPPFQLEHGAALDAAGGAQQQAGNGASRGARSSSSSVSNQQAPPPQPAGGSEVRHDANSPLHTGHLQDAA